MSSCSKVAAIDLSASEARLRSAQVLAEGQLRRVEAAEGGADEHAIDMLFLLQESVLVLTETHAMLAKLAVADARRSQPQQAEATPSPVRDRQTAVAALVFLIALIASVCALEILDPTPMGAAAAIVCPP